MRVVVNKTKLFRIISEHAIFVPKMKHTHFSKTTDGLSYYLEWNTESGHDYTARLSFESNYPELMIKMYDKHTKETRTIIKVRWNNVNEFVTML